MSLHFDSQGYPFHTRARHTTPEDDVCASDCEACEYEKLPVCVMGCEDGWIEDVNGTGVSMDCPLHKGQKTRRHFQLVTPIAACPVPGCVGGMIVPKLSAAITSGALSGDPKPCPWPGHGKDGQT